MKKLLAILVSVLLLATMIPLGAVSVSAAYDFLFPVNNGGKIAYVYGYSASYGGEHTGIDIHSNGDDTIYAAASGKVVATANACPHISVYPTKCEHYNTFGNYIKIQHDDGTYAYYGHLKQNTLQLSVGSVVSKGQAIATMGSSGYSSGKHLHFEVRLSDGTTTVNVNPVSNGGSINYSTSGYGGQPTERYDANAAVAYAKAHWDDGVGACATFVSSCLAAGGCDAWSSNVTELRNKLVNGGWGTEYVLTKSGSAIYQSQNEGKLSAGDPIFYYCNKCGKRMHVVICGGFDSAGKATAYAHNVAWNNVNYLGAFEDEHGHTGSDIVAYSFHINSAGSVPSTPITYATIDTGVYAIKNNGNQLYMNVAYGLDENAQNIHTYEFGYWNSQLYEITPSTTTAGYMMRPLSSASRVVNVYADTVVSGKNVCIYDNVEDGSQRWNFEAVDGGYVIRNVQNPSCVLTVPGGSDVCVQTYTGADNQVWTLENVVSYDANGGTGAPALQLKNYNESIVLSTTVPSRKGYVFKGWATEASATVAQYAAGGEYNNNANVELYAVWECDHTYDNACDTTCNTCGEVREVSGHTYSSKVTTAATCGKAGVKTYTCSVCGDSYTEVIPATGKHVYDDDYDADCNVCGDVRQVPEKPPVNPDLPEDAPAFVVENATACAGEEFTVAIRTQRNSGIVSFKLKLAYDSDVLELVSATEQDFANLTFSDIDNNPFTINWVDAIHPNNTTNGVVVLLTFRVKEDAPISKTDITLSYDVEDVYDQNFDNVDFCVENGVVDIVDFVSGDVNGDGKVNNKDLGLLQRYLNAWDVTVVAKAADANGDGKVNNKDLGMLQRYLNGWNVELG